MMMMRLLFLHEERGVGWFACGVIGYCYIQLVVCAGHSFGGSCIEIR